LSVVEISKKRGGQQPRNVKDVKEISRDESGLIWPHLASSGPEGNYSWHLALLNLGSATERIMKAIQENGREKYRFRTSIDVTTGLTMRCGRWRRAVV
jgi:hypothetical protein